MGRIYKHFWHAHDSDEDTSCNQEKIIWKAWVKGKYGPSLFKCDECVESISFSSDRGALDCDLCDKEWHHDCVPSSPDEINHPFHPYHPLKLLIDGPPEYSDGKCVACHEPLRSFFHHCSICDFSIHVRCSNNPPPLIVDAPRCHNHALTLMARNDTFTCNACGTHGEQCPYVCAPCALMFHRDCITLPHVININRHDHRISHTYSLGFGDWKCKICHQKIDWRYGAYSCSKCPDFVAHSKCATRNDVWDGVELEGVPEEFVDVSPFKVIEAGVINHFSHEEHNLRLIEDATDSDRDESIRCEACTSCIFSDKHYSCMECDFFLHETCANLPLQKRHGLCRKPLTLVSTACGLFKCFACETKSNGFRYKCGDITLDVRCASMSWYCDYECHPHTLFLTTLDRDTCGGCLETFRRVLHCVECDFSLDFKCATLPRKIKHRCDDHFMSLCFGEEARKGKYWCEICETVLDPQKWFYSCDGDCGVVSHTQCVLGELWNAKPQVLNNEERTKIELVPNDGMSRPKCGSCGSRCQQPLLFKFSNSNMEESFCDTQCHENYSDALQLAAQQAWLETMVDVA